MVTTDDFTKSGAVVVRFTTVPSGSSASTEFLFFTVPAICSGHVGTSPVSALVGSARRRKARTVSIAFPAVHNSFGCGIRPRPDRHWMGP